MEQPNVHVVHYPDYELVRKFLPVISGQHNQTFKTMTNIIREHWGTPQKTRDWSNPDEWIPQILKGAEEKLAFYLWKNSEGYVNPRHVTGLLHFCSVYELVQIGSEGTVEITTHGMDFVNHPSGETVRTIDYLEGLFHLLAIVSEHGPGKRSDLLPHFSEFLQTYSRLKAGSSLATAWFWRMVNLTNRRLLEVEGNIYRVSQAGLDYLGRAEQFFVGSRTESTETTLQDIRKLIREHEMLVRQKIAETLTTIHPYHFEKLIKNLLEAMGYQDVVVTSPSNDGGVDVIANIQVGITKVREVVQVKRHRGSIGRPVLDQLRGSLHRFGANRGTIITTGKFTKDTHEAAFEMGAAPIMLIDGETLIGLLIENQIGARMDTVKVLKFEAGDFVLEEESSNL